MSPPTSASASTHAAGASIRPDQQLQSSTQLQADLDAVNGAATEADLLAAVAQLQQDYQEVAGSQANSADADWQLTLTKLQKALADVSQLANTNSSNPDAPNPLNPGPSANRSTPASTSVSEIITEIKEAFDLLTSVISHLAFTVVVNNGGQPGGTVVASMGLGGPYPAINCGQGDHMCKGAVLALATVGLSFQPAYPPHKIKAIDDPSGACNPVYASTPPTTGANCTVTATSGVTISITPHWE